MTELKAEPALRRCNDLSEYPLSLAQDDVWLQCQLYRDSDLYKLGAELSVSGPLDLTLFSRAFQASVGRHEAVRAVFDAPDGIPVQRVSEDLAVSLPVTDLSAHPPEDRVALIVSHVRRLLSAPYDLAKGPLYRAELLRFGAKDHYLMLAFHRLILDGFHAAQFVEEIARTYCTYLRGEAAPDPLKFQYGDFAVWQRKRLSSSGWDAPAQYWRRQLQEPLPQTLLPPDRPVPSARTFEVKSFARTPGPTLCSSLRVLEKPCRTTTFRIVLAAFAALLSRLCSEGEVLIAVPFSTRPREMSGTLGFFSNLLPLRIDLRGDPTFRTLLMETNSQLRHAAAHKEFSLAEMLQRPRTHWPQGRPVLPIAVSQVGAWELRAEGLRMTSSGVYSTAMIHDVCLALSERTDGFDLYYLYASELFECRSVTRWAEQLENLLQEVALRPDVRLSCLDTLPKALPLHDVNTRHEPGPPLTSGRNCTPPRTQLERQLAAIWEEVLQCGPIGIDDNFLELGAHSLMIARVHRKLRTLLLKNSGALPAQPATQLSLRSIFDNPTIRNLARLLSPWFPEQAVAEQSQEADAPPELMVQR